MPPPPLPASNRRAVLSWALYDWGNSAFATTVMAGFFPVFFKQYWSAGADVTESTFRLGIASSVASVAVAILAPLLGAIADRARAKKSLLFSFTTLGVLATAGLYGVAQGDWATAAALFALGTVGFAGANIFYDALLVVVSDGERSDGISALGYALGYLGGGLLFALNVSMTLAPQAFGLENAAQAVRLSFLMVAVWWAVFSIPLALFVPEVQVGERIGVLRAAREGFGQLAATWRELRQLRPVVMFLCAYWLYIDGVDTVIRMAVDYGMSLGLRSESLITALLITQFVGFPAALLFGKLGPRIGTKRAIFIGLGVYVAVTLYAFRMQTEAEFYALAVAIGCVQGGVQSLSRSLYSRLIPAEKSGEFFGFYNMLGRFAAVIGPALMGIVSLATGSPRLSILSVLVLFGGGALLLWRVDDTPAPKIVNV